jgi:glutathione synthase/RimK-type ligase-like ATP-grasp enzyme
MKKVLIIGSNRQLAGSKNDTNILAQSLVDKLGVDFAVSSYFIEDLLFCINDQKQQIIDSKSGQDVANADLVICLNWYQGGVHAFYRDIMFTVALYLQARGTDFWNSEALHQRSTTKLSMMMQLALAGIPIPATYFSLDHEALRQQAVDLPCIIKTIKGSRGNDNHLAASRKELGDILADSRPYMLQEFISNDHDLRMVCFRGEPELIIKRTRRSNDTHLNNTSQGALAELVVLDQAPSNSVQLARKICALTGREIAGVDLLLANDGSERIVCLEVNAIPQLTSGSFVQEKSEAFAKSILKQLKGTA